MPVGRGGEGGGGGGGQQSKYVILQTRAITEFMYITYSFVTIQANTSLMNNF